MPFVTVIAQSGKNFGAVSDPVYIIKEAVGDGTDRFIVTQAVWVYETSTDPVLNSGWNEVKQLFIDADSIPANKRDAVLLDTFDAGDGRPVQTRPVRT